jgi:glycosyltransferase involved in cell wall biosynthesis
LKNSEDLMDVSIIIPCKNEVNNLKSTIDSLMSSKNSLLFEIIVVDDASIDSSTEFLTSPLYKHIYKEVVLIKTNNLGAAQTRNAGAQVAKGKYLFFCDAHVQFPDRWIDDLVDTLETSTCQIVAPCIVDMYDASSSGYGQTWDQKLKVKWLTNKPYSISEIPIACGCAFGITRECFDKINGFDKLFQVWGKEDEELCLKAWLYGYKTVVNPEVKIKHLFRKKHPYEVTSVNFVYNFLCLAYSHFGLHRLEKTIHLAKYEYGFSDAASQIKKNADMILKQREKYLNERKLSDDFFFEKFNIPF